MKQLDDVRTVLATLRPQPFGRSSPHDAIDPIIEPMWAGMRVLAAVDEAGAVLVDEIGAPVEDHERIVLALPVALQAEAVILDGYLTKQVGRDETGHYAAVADDGPSAGFVITKMMFGVRRDRARERIAEMDAAEAARTFHPDEIVTFVATDILWLDGASLLDVPLLERKRLLESVITVSEVVRYGVHVRPPIESWIGSWRAQGFTGLTYKAANSRYSPGVAAKDWASSPMPRHR